MAYASSKNPPVLSSFEKDIPPEIFEEVTSISVDTFRLLRDGGEVVNETTGQKEWFEGHLFNEEVFNEAVQEFMQKKEKLADYFMENAREDIFDYIPPQKTNQIFTPKRIVKKMVDELEEQDPGCFDGPNRTFIDLYMKSGLFPAEIIKRLFQSRKMKELFPDDQKRLKHIIENQVYGLAPSEIIYNISVNFILGTEKLTKKPKHNFRYCDALKLVKNQELEQKLDKLFPERKE
jgi:hypothetical protein